MYRPDWYAGICRIVALPGLARSLTDTPNPSRAPACSRVLPHRPTVSSSPTLREDRLWLPQ